MALSVLIVDDDSSVREFLAFVLMDEGFRVRTAGDGCDALTAVEQERPDVVLTDLMMPRMDGYELIARLRRERLVERGIIAMSAVLSAGGRDLHADLVFAKPFDVDEMVASIHSLAETSRAS